MVNINLTNYILERVYSKTETDNQIKDYIGNIDLFEVVTELPSEDIEEKIYLVPYTSSEEHNIYDAYIYKDDEWKQIDRFNIDGVDLSEINTLINNKSDINHTHTVEDITDFPSIPTDISDLTDEYNKLYLDNLYDMNEHSLNEIIDTALIPYYTKTQSDNKYLTSHQDISMKADKVVATSISNGLMSSSDKKKLDSIESGTGEIDDTVTRNSPNPVKSSGIWSALVEKQEDIAQLDNIVDKYGNYIFNDDGFLFYGMIDQIYYDYGNTGELHFINSNGDDNCFDDISLNGHTHSISDVSNLQTSLNNKQETLVSGTNIKTVNNESLLGNGNINISGSGEQNVFYGVCHTIASTQTKMVTVDDWSFTTGNVLFVKFINGNSYDGTAIISIDGVTKDIATVGSTKTSRYYWKAGEVVGFVYDGSNMVLLEGGTASTTYYGITQLSSSTSSTSETLSATPKAVKTAYDLANSKQDKLVSGTNIKTINNQSLLGNGNIDIQSSGSVDIATSWGSTTSDSKVPSEKLTKTALDGKAPNVHTHDDYDIEINDMEIQGDWGISSQGEFNTNVYGVIVNLDSALSSTVKTSDIANDLTTTTSGKVLDARQGKALEDSKADSIHTHTVSDVTDMGTVELLVNYTDGTSETLTLYKQNSS